jgi:hypothetical protein
MLTEYKQHPLKNQGVSEKYSAGAWRYNIFIIKIMRYFAITLLISRFLCDTDALAKLL